MEIVRKFLTPDEISNPAQRYNAEDDTIQFSPDGGTTWVDSPASDVRHSDIFRQPALTGEDAQCDAAARITAAWREMLGIFDSSVDAAQFGTLILEFLLALAGGTAFLGPVGLLVDLIIITFYALIAIGQSVIAAAFTEEVWDGILCIIYSHIGADGQVSAEQREAILSDIAAQYPGTVYNVLILVINLFGEVLMSNAGVERAETGDCASCIVVGYKWDWKISDGGWSIVASRGTGRDSNGWESIYNFAGLGNTEIRIGNASLPTKAITGFTVEYLATVAPNQAIFCIDNSDGGYNFTMSTGSPVVADETGSFEPESTFWRLDISVSGVNTTYSLQTLTVYTDDISGLTGGAPVHG